MPTAIRPALGALLLLACSCSRPSGSSLPGPDASAPPAVDALVDQIAPPDAAPVEDAQVDLGRGPPYPIVLAHGFFGFDRFGPLDYFYQVKPILVAAGHSVHVTTVDPFNSSLVRGEQLLAQVRAVLDQTGAAKVNIVAHSQGGIDARYVASKIPERVGAVLTIATPHLGADIADGLLGKSPVTVAVTQAFAKLLGKRIWGDVAADADMIASLNALSSEGMAAFNAAFPNQRQVQYYSIGGRSGGSLGDSICLAPGGPAFVARYDQIRDPVEPMLLPIHEFISKPNDGMIQSRSTKWGVWLGCIPADHMDEVGQFLGDEPGSGNTFDYLQFYKDVAAFLVAQGY